MPKVGNIPSNFTLNSITDEYGVNKETGKKSILRKSQEWIVRNEHKPQLSIEEISRMKSVELEELIRTLTVEKVEQLLIPLEKAKDEVQKKIHSDLEIALDNMMTATTISECINVWTRFKQYQSTPAFVAAKNLRKSQLDKDYSTIEKQPEEVIYNNDKSDF